MANINKFSPVSPDTYLKAGSDMALAKFGHLNAIVDAYNTLDTASTASAAILTYNGLVATGTSITTAVSTLNTTVTNGTIGTGGVITQTPAITDAVTLNASKGVITTVSTTLAAGASSTAFTFTNSFIKTSSVILTNCQQGATGSSVNALVSSIANGSCSITLTNVGGTTTGAAAIVIHFAIL